METNEIKLLKKYQGLLKEQENLVSKIKNVEKLLKEKGISLKDLEKFEAMTVSISLGFDHKKDAEFKESQKAFEAFHKVFEQLRLEPDLLTNENDRDGSYYLYSLDADPKEVHKRLQKLFPGNVSFEHDPESTPSYDIQVALSFKKEKTEGNLLKSLAKLV